MFVPNETIDSLSGGFFLIPQIHGRKAGYETELHLTEPLNDIRRVPLEKRVDYLTDLDRQAEQKTATKKVRSVRSEVITFNSSLARHDDPEDSRPERIVIDMHFVRHTAISRHLNCILGWSLYCLSRLNER